MLQIRALKKRLVKVIFDDKNECDTRSKGSVKDSQA